MSELETFLRVYGLWALFFAAAIEGDMTLLLTGMLVHLDIWPPGKALLIGAGGALAGDSFYFWLGHGTARRWLTTAHGQRVLPKIEKAAQRYGVKSLFFARYVYGARIATMFFWGMRRLSYLKFVAVDAINCFLWAVLFGGAGYLFADSIQSMIGELHRIETWLLVGIVVFFLLLALRYYLAELARIRDELRNGGKQP